MTNSTAPRAPGKHADDIEIARIEKNAREQIRVHLNSFRGYELASVRVWLPADGDKPDRPTIKGVTFRVALLTDLIAALEKARAAAATSK